MRKRIKITGPALIAVLAIPACQESTTPPLTFEPGPLARSLWKRASPCGSVR